MISRRAFLGGAAGAAALGGGAWATLVRDGVDNAAPLLPAGSTSTTTTVAPTTTVAAQAATSAARLPVTDRVLVVLEMAGGNDALNTLVPADAGVYRDLRPELALGDTEMIALPGTPWGLHPSLVGLVPFWDAGTMSAIAGVAMPQQSRSHFTAMDSWWSGVAGAPSQTGWLGRWLDASLDAERNGVDDPLRAIALGGGSPALVGTRTMATAIRNPSTFQLMTLPGTDADALVDAFLATAAPLSNDPVLAAAQGAIPATLDAVALLASASGADDALGDQNQIPGAGTTAVDLLATAARIIQMGIGTRVLTVGVSGFDTHAGQLDTHDGLLRDIADGLEGFFASLAASGDLDRVMVLTTSEFGRRAAENGSGGTDHGNGGLQFAFGPSVAGGVVHGDYQLGALVDGDIPVAVDTRSGYLAALEWLGGAGAGDGIFDETPESLPLLTA
ncbi:MAG: DUF1501 domain-containing protein [Actinomycetota bacterium]